MKWIRRFSTKFKMEMSLFYTLFSSFIVIILLLVSINLVSYSFFRNSIKDEIIVNSGMNLNTTASNYEKHIKLIRSYMLSYLFNNDTQILRSASPGVRYDIVTDAQKSLRYSLNNSLLYIDNMIYYFKDSGLVIDKDGTRDPLTMFNKFYAHPLYTADFWSKEMDSAKSFKVYPSATFQISTAFEKESIGNLMPIMVKNAYDHNFALIVLMKSTALYDAFYQPKEGSNLVILDESNKVIFTTDDSIELPAAVNNLQGTGYKKQDDIYYFYKKGGDTGFTYIEVLSDRGLVDQMQKLNILMVALLALSVLISLVVSYFIAKRFHNPLANMLRSSQALGSGGLPWNMNSRIKEFNVLHNTLSHLSKSNKAIHEDLESKNSLLQQFAYMTRLKKIHGRDAPLPAAIDANKPYRLVLFQLVFKDRFLIEISNAPQRALNMYKELIHANFAAHYKDSLTFQLERDQILTILFVEDEEKDKQSNPLQNLIEIFELDSSYCNFTIAPSPVRKHSTDIAETYQNVLDLIKQRRLGEDVQVITEWHPQPALMIPSPLEESELTANLHSGSDSVTVPLVHKLLDQLAKMDALAKQFQDFSKDVVNRTFKVMYAQNISFGMSADEASPYDQLKSCYTLPQYKAFFEQFLSRAAELIRGKRSETDVMTKFVMEYVESNYGDDLSLDAIASKLGITGPYLSTYFKEKTGTNFSDYIFSVRMNKAMGMLQDTNLKIQEIASLIGYFTVASFNRVFKKHTGMTPSEYRRQNNKWQGEES
ncbi:AraC family transcriptional regulator [Paenibacillus sp. HB172176]|uniref:helix-turn-helix domain-containing protein n=1 Tax=Paenibacillus sp. HB172176 TaxID=2493690 RepID=UPI001439E63B|nr:AraC family transcriptional regulator [Paenibacillus sp. HB172176]